jgi:hypothetical protein
MIVVRETFDKIVVFGEGNDRFDIPKSEIQNTGRNVLIGLNLYEIANKYKVNRQEPLPTTIPIEHWTQGENLDGLLWLLLLPLSIIVAIPWFTCDPFLE